MAKKFKSKKIDHILIGFDVSYLGYVWKVTAAHLKDASEDPWLTMRRGNVEVTAKPKEVVPVFD